MDSVPVVSKYTSRSSTRSLSKMSMLIFPTVWAGPESSPCESLASKTALAMNFTSLDHLVACGQMPSNALSMPKKTRTRSFAWAYSCPFSMYSHADRCAAMASEPMHMTNGECEMGADGTESRSTNAFAACMALDVCRSLWRSSRERTSAGNGGAYLEHKSSIVLYSSADLGR